ncbi:hypothetical protein Tc00.1047053507981.40 [Trypanosoma cruzi]|uniref:ATPase n=1 Tax=Trypanosoma cruzi (strain CL Brener) TaxID=353153 RepID=Q4CWD1_TRYCC|nr:hypothetical protein Tc00.1047053507981.40 [Trypanosoma cruzi]EAN84584.1 hypothetical protein Tc00.1047053507981.40 [Trypanosoma cruzi]|eukprot:XP_806435.1 hypothetical protein [Trypanosoma cruzi strain CL Brener]
MIVCFASFILAALLCAPFSCPPHPLLGTRPRRTHMHDTPTTVCVDAFLCAAAYTLEPFVAASCVLFFVFLLFFTFFFFSAVVLLLLVFCVFFLLFTSFGAL